MSVYQQDVRVIWFHEEYDRRWQDTFGANANLPEDNFEFYNIHINGVGLSDESFDLLCHLQGKSCGKANQCANCCWYGKKNHYFLN